MIDTIDSHQHFWRLDRGDYSWLTPDLAPLHRDFLPADLEPQLERAGVSKTVLVQAAPTAAETEFMLELAGNASFVAGVVGWVDFDAADAPEAIHDLARNELLVGLRPMIQDIADPDWMLRAELKPAFAAMADRGLVLDALVKPPHLEALLELARRHPGLSIVLDHGAKPPIASGDLSAWKRGVAALAQETSMVCKLSGLVTEAHGAEQTALAECVGHLLENFGPPRLMWGSDWPVCELVCSYATWHAASERLLASLSESERASIFCGTARKTYGI